ncbi:Flp pilus assembly complex ATPase component TadA [Blastopirellula sp. JC732]|uniref:Flp pilus assembly complex ATPase component TadA n=1 Tax=Blastopirellula sediminis TaxID=2894196 RepID=A0A9X1MKR1_9BACT|nr:ATPase, T2SS/T4P/T4SS family [Blastopirellula sediminis]MCC9608582.1 Flp pilus assembly complex ATPase component TadA [Blastopirellula sediminis]MCC9628641.1 Flp pilus assembly complex ATPase component TadA [Blastopirellula sediminis]
MKVWYNNVVDPNRQVKDVEGNRIRIGRAPYNEIVLDSPYIAEEAAVLYRRGSSWELVALGLNGLKVGDRQLYNGESCKVATNNQIAIFPFSLTLDLPCEEAVTKAEQRAALDQTASKLISDVHLELLNRRDMELEAKGGKAESVESLWTLEQDLELIAKEQKLFTGKLIEHVAAYGMRDRLLSDLCEILPEHGDTGLYGKRHWSRLVSVVPEREQELDRTAEYLRKSLKLHELTDLSAKIDVVERSFWDKWEAIGGGIHKDFIQYMALRFVKKSIKDIVFGYGPLEDLLRLPTISEIMVVDREHIYIERNGVLENSGRRFTSDAVIEAIIQRIVSRVGRRIDKSSPLVDARLSDGSRVNAVIPPLAVSGPCITIRKFPYRKLLIDDLVAKKALSRSVAEFFRAIVLHRCNILISGGTGTGKTTLLNCMSDFIPDRERIVTVEDTAELQLNKEHVVRMETKESNIEGKGAYTIRDLVKNSLRMRPDRIVVGECRGPEALDMLQAMNTGHDGSMTTIHANNTGDAIRRLEVLVQMAADLPLEAIHQQIASAIDIVIQLRRMRNGRRVVCQVSELVGLNPTTKQLMIRDLFLWDDATEDGIQATGHVPSFMNELIETGRLTLDGLYLH